MLYERFKEEVQMLFKDLHMKVGAVIIALLIISFLFYILRPEKKAARVLFFPKVSYSLPAKSPVLHSEQRSLPELRTREENIRLLVQELLLGPIQPELSGFCPPGTKLVRLFLKDNNLYLDLSAELLEPAKDKLLLSAEEKLALLKKNILFNFRDVKNIHIFLNGQIPQF